MPGIKHIFYQAFQVPNAYRNEKTKSEFLRDAFNDEEWAKSILVESAHATRPTQNFTQNFTEPLLHIHSSPLNRHRLSVKSMPLASVCSLTPNGKVSPSRCVATSFKTTGHTTKISMGKFLWEPGVWKPVVRQKTLRDHPIYPQLPQLRTLKAQ